jgi:hypothetical protein
VTKDILVAVGPRTYADIRALAVVRDVMTNVVADRCPDEIRSGGAEGTDLYIEQLAWEWSIPFVPMLPRRNEWNGPGGYQERNEDMAKACTRLVGFSCRWPESGGAIWTANKAEELGKPVERYVIPDAVVDGQIDLWDRGKNLVQLLVRDGLVTRRSERSPQHAEKWVGQAVDPLLSQLRRQKLRVRWTARPR